MRNGFSKETIALIIVMVTSFVTSFSSSAITLALPAIGKEFNSDALLLSWVVAAFLLSTAAFLLPLGRLSDIVGRKKIFVIGAATFTVSSLFSALTQSIEVLILLRILQGIASAMIFSNGMAIIALVYPAQARGKAMGFISSAVYIGLSLGPVLGGLLTHYLGWRSIFYFSAFLSGIATLLTVWRLKGEWISNQGESFDKIGSVSYMLAVILTLYGFSEVARLSWAKYMLAVGICLLIAFICYELKQEYPLFPIRLFMDNQVFAFSNIAAMINYSATFAISFLLSLYLQVVLGYDSQISGMILLVQPLIMAIFSPVAGTLSDRIEPRIVSSWGMALSTMGLFGLIFATTQPAVAMIITCLILVGFGFALFASPNNNAIMGAVEKKNYGVAASALGTVRLIGQAVSMAIVTLLLSDVSNSTNSAVGYTQLIATDIHWAFIIFTIICGLGIFPSLVRGKVRAV